MAQCLPNSTQIARSTAKRVLAISAGSFPSRVEPVHGVFVKERLRFVSQLPGVEVKVISPIPYFPPIKWFKRWYPWSQLPMHEVVDSVEVARSRYLLPPLVGGYIHPWLISSAAHRAIKSLGNWSFNLIDAHFVYPNGVVAEKLARLYQLPYVVTGRGEDILRFPDLPIIGEQIRRALKNATQLIALSDEIAEAMIRNGGDPKRVTVIPNGVDCEKFAPADMLQARQVTGLPNDRPIVVTAGYRIERKGYHILVDAIPAIRKVFPDVLVVIVGGEARWERDYLPEINERIAANNVADHVKLVGAVPQTELRNWYNSADIFALLTSREGSPNVLMEALACGLPSVATPVGGIPQVLSDSSLGLVLRERTAAEAARGITEALARNWDRKAIRFKMEQQSWHATAEQVRDVFDRALFESTKSAFSAAPD